MFHRRPPAVFALLLLPFALLAAPQSPFDPFSTYQGRIVPGRIQHMVASDQDLVIDRILGPGQQLVEAWTEPSLMTPWQRTFVSVEDEIVLEGDRVAFDAAATKPTSASIGRYIFNAQTGAQISYRRGGLIGHAGKFIVEHGDTITSLADGSEVFGAVSGVRHVRFIASVGTRFLLLVSEAGSWNVRRPVLYDPVLKKDLWANRVFPQDVLTFFDEEIGSSTRLAFDGFPILIPQSHRSPKDTTLRFMLVTESGGATPCELGSFGIPSSAIHAGVDFTHGFGPASDRMTVAAVSSGGGATPGAVEVITVFNRAGRTTARAVVDLSDTVLVWSGITRAGNLALFLNELRPRHRNLLVTFTLPGLARSEVECGHDAQVNSPPGLSGNDLFIWERIPRFAKGAKVPPRSRMTTPVALSVDPRSASVMSWYPFDSDEWQLMDFDRDRIRHTVNASHLFLPFQRRDGTRDVTLLLPIPRSVRGWLGATLSLAPQWVYTDSDVKMTWGPPYAAVSVDQGQLTGETWRTPSAPGTATFTLSIGSVTETFPVEVHQRPANQPPLPRFRLVDSSLVPFEPEASVDARYSFDADGRIVSYTFDWGDKTPASSGTGSFARHVYAAPGDYVVTLTVTDDKGLTAQAKKTITVSAVWGIDGERRGIPAGLAGTKNVGYDIDITTGDADGAGTNANVYVAMYGPPTADQERTRTSEIHVYDAIDEAHKDAFERGHTDVFKAHQGTAVGIPDVAHLDDIDYITVRHDNFGGKAEWLVHSLRIRNQSSKKEWYFEPDAWLERNKGVMANGLAVFRPTGGTYPRGLLFGGAATSWDMTEAGANVFILKATSGTFYFTSLDRANGLEVYLNGIVVGRQYARGSGIATPPYLPKTDWGVASDITKLTAPTRFTVRQQLPDGPTSESAVWVFPASWANYASEALAAAVLAPLRGETEVLNYAFSVRTAMKTSATWDNVMAAALAPVISFGSQSMVLFGAPSTLHLSATMEERVGLYVADGLNKALKVVGMALASTVVGETISLFKTMITAREFGKEIGNVTAAGAAAAGGLVQLGRMADCNPNLVTVSSMLGVAKARIETMFARLDANDPAGYRDAFDDLRTIAVGAHPQSAALPDYVIDYRALGIADLSPGLTTDNYCLSMLCLLELNNIQSWKSGGIAPCFPTNAIYPSSDAAKKADTAAAMTSYEPLWKDIMRVAGIVISIAALK